jgi:hypothetical protein
MRLAVGLALATSGVGAAGCWSTGPVTLKLVYHPSLDESETEATPTVPCRIRITTVTDGRPDTSRNSLGDRGGGPVLAAHVPEWVGDGLDRLVEHGLVSKASFSAAPRSADTAAAAADVRAEVSIRRVYTHGIASDLAAVVALDVRYTPRDGSAWQRGYRASAEKLNWFATESEVQEVLNRALEDVIRQIARDLGAVCAGDASMRNAR